MASDPSANDGKTYGFRRILLYAFASLFVLSLYLTDTVIMPVIERRKDSSPMIACQSHLKVIRQAILLYTNENQGRYPDSFGTLLLNEDITSDCFICCASQDTPAQGPTTQAVVNDMFSGGHLSYVYLGKGLTTATTPANAVIAYESLSNHKTGMNVLFADDRVVFVKPEEGEAIIAKATAGRFPVTMPSN